MIKIKLLQPKTLTILLTGLAVMLWSNFAMASPADIDIQTVISNLMDSQGSFIKLLTAGTFLIGLFYAYKTVYYLKWYAETRTQNMMHYDYMKKVLICAFVTIVLLYWPAVLHGFLKTFFDDSKISPLSYGGANQTVHNALKMGGGFVQIIGYIAFIRGWLLVMKSAENNGGQQGGLAKALTHIIAGLLAVNIFGLWSVLTNSLGLSF